MDYKKIYNEFILDRRSKEKQTEASGAYTERHHITPRCMLGSNENNNLIRLTYRDHVFAHALLLKGASDVWEKWNMAASMSAVLNFDGSGMRPKEERQHLDKVYKWARKMHGETITGKNHPGYKHETFTLWNIDDGSKIRGTRQELIKKTGLDFQRIYDFATGRRTYTDGWCSNEEEAIDRSISKKLIQTRNDRIKKDLFYNIDGRCINQKSFEPQHLSKMGLCTNTRSICRTKGFCRGWTQDPSEAEMRREGRWYQYKKKNNEIQNEILFKDLNIL